MKFDLKIIDDTNIQKHLYFFGKDALEKMILSLIEKYYGEKTMEDIRNILSISEMKKIKIEAHQFKRR